MEVQDFWIFKFRLESVRESRCVYGSGMDKISLQCATFQNRFFGVLTRCLAFNASYVGPLWWFWTENWSGNRFWWSPPSRWFRKQGNQSASNSSLHCIKFWIWIEKSFISSRMNSILLSGVPERTRDSKIPLLSLAVGFLTIRSRRMCPKIDSEKWPVGAEFYPCQSHIRNEIRERSLKNEFFFDFHESGRKFSWNPWKKFRDD